jgi:hypothetical protein
MEHKREFLHAGIAEILCRGKMTGAELFIPKQNNNQ